MDKPKFYCADSYNAAYAFHKKWADVQNTDENWEKIVHEAELLIKKLGTGFSLNLVMTVLEELETRICGKPDGEIGFANYYIKLLRYFFKVRTNKELAEKIMEMGDG